MLSKNFQQSINNRFSLEDWHETIIYLAIFHNNIVCFCNQEKKNVSQLRKKEKTMVPVMDR